MTKEELEIEANDYSAGYALRSSIRRAYIAAAEGRELRIESLLNQIKVRDQETETLKAEIERLKRDGWVSVEERLPNKTGLYLVYEINYGEGCVDINRFDKYNDTFYYLADAFHPTHWRKLPEPPIAEQALKGGK